MSFSKACVTGSLAVLALLPSISGAESAGPSAESAQTKPRTDAVHAAETNASEESPTPGPASTEGGDSPGEGTVLIHEHDTAGKGVNSETSNVPAMEAAAEEPAPESESDASDASEVALSDTDPSALTHFSEDLAPYGQWVNDPAYGTVWVPAADAVGPNFAPYVTRGRWALTTDDEWIWVSDYPFGAIVFHYGRWVWVRSYGWSWIPGRAYAPAWVVFRTSYYGSPYVGWAPLPPRYIWRQGRLIWLVRVPPAPYVFAPSYAVFQPSLSYYVLRHRHRTRQLAEHSRRYYTSQPSRGRYESPPLDVARVPRSARPTQRVVVPRRVRGARVAQREGRTTTSDRLRLRSRAMPDARLRPPKKAKPRRPNNAERKRHKERKLRKRDTRSKTRPRGIPTPSRRVVPSNPRRQPTRR